MKYYLDLYLENCRSRYTGRSFEIAKVHCSRIMYYLSEQGITEIQEISFFAIDMLIHTDFHCSKDTREMYLLHARFMLDFFASLNIIPVELSVMLDDRIYFQVGRMELFSSEHQTLLEQFRNKSSLFSACEFHERISAFETVLRDLGYEPRLMIPRAYTFQLSIYFCLTFFTKYIIISFLRISAIHPTIKNSISYIPIVKQELHNIPTVMTSIVCSQCLTPCVSLFHVFQYSS